MQPSDFFNKLNESGIEFFAGVPDSLLKSFCFYAADHLPKERHVIAANEGAAIGLATGYHLGTGKVPAVYMQNSGIGNAVNPLLSLADPEVYAIPMLLMIGWRGEPGKPDEPQHKKQGRVLCAMLESMEIPYLIVDSNSEPGSVITTALRHLETHHTPYALVIRDGTFADYKYKGKTTQHGLTLSRERAIEIIASSTNRNDVIISTTGKASRELNEVRAKTGGTFADFLTVGAMGHCNQIALGLAIARPEKRIICLDGDGAVLMHMGSLPIIGDIKPSRFRHIILNNCSHESVGGQPTVAGSMNFKDLAHSSGYAHFFRADSEAELQKVLPLFLDAPQTAMLEVRVTLGSRSDLGRPKQTPLENKKNFIEALNRN